jgi:hypothetical protein
MPSSEVLPLIRVLTFADGWNTHPIRVHNAPFTWSTRFKSAGGEVIVPSLFKGSGFRKRRPVLFMRLSVLGSLGHSGVSRTASLCSRRWHPSARRPMRSPFIRKSTPSSLWLRPTRKKSISLAPSVTADRGYPVPAMSGRSSPVPFSVLRKRARLARRGRKFPNRP